MKTLKCECSFTIVFVRQSLWFSEPLGTVKIIPGLPPNPSSAQPNPVGGFLCNVMFAG